MGDLLKRSQGPHVGGPALAGRDERNGNTLASGFIA